MQDSYLTVHFVTNGGIEIGLDSDALFLNSKDRRLLLLARNLALNVSADPEGQKHAAFRLNVRWIDYPSEDAQTKHRREEADRLRRQVFDFPKGATWKVGLYRNQQGKVITQWGMLMGREYVKLEGNGIMEATGARRQVDAMNRLCDPVQERWHKLLLNQPAAGARHIIDPFSGLDFDSEEVETAINTVLNIPGITWTAAQRKVIESLREFPERLLLIQGFPGTGKTLTLMGIAAVCRLLGIMSSTPLPRTSQLTRHPCEFIAWANEKGLLLEVECPDEQTLMKEPVDRMIGKLTRAVTTKPLGRIAQTSTGAEGNQCRHDEFDTISDVLGNISAPEERTDPLEALNNKWAAPHDTANGPWHDDHTEPLEQSADETALAGDTWADSIHPLNDHTETLEPFVGDETALAANSSGPPETPSTADCLYKRNF
ncbi:hypothetical protein CFD26_100743 [Aspergillus turcosus]|uniref:DNA2/NAM7 helicase helicase domain-containing protein n=1 Tax=Aspergillus turcosus TaxID=1245748 RepID=A0A3R7LV23_9EURO|nr:hypothetical protein CFD26_100743 [Aspergillus turcosus]